VVVLLDLRRSLAAAACLLEGAIATGKIAPMQWTAEALLGG
jgi:hypothetical protein